MRNILIHVQQPISAVGYYRAILPYRHCHKELEAEGIKLHIADQVRLGSQYDAIILRREVDAAFLLHVNQRRKKTGCKFVWDIDDDFWSVPEWSPVLLDRRTMECVDMAHTLADEIWASTEPLAKKCGDRAKVMPNLADLDDWFPDDANLAEGYVSPPNGAASLGPINILWSGSSTHRHDIAECHDAILATAAKYGNKIKFHFYGYCPEPIQSHLLPNDMRSHEWTRFEDYFDAMRSIQPTIALAPLQDCEFNTSKSGIRWMENTLAGAAVIASDCEAYKDASYKVDGTSRTWYAAIPELIESVGFFGKTIEVKTADHNRITQNWSWSAASEKAKWMDGFRRIVS